MQQSHREMTDRLAKDGGDIISGLTPEKADMLHMALGIAGEAGEIVDCIKKHVIYGKELDNENLIEELGDVLFYINHLLGITNQDMTIDNVMLKNMHKLSKRYSSGTYSDKQAITRADKA